MRKRDGRVMRIGRIERGEWIEASGYPRIFGARMRVLDNVFADLLLWEFPHFGQWYERVWDTQRLIMRQDEHQSSTTNINNPFQTSQAHPHPSQPRSFIEPPFDLFQEISGITTRDLLDAAAGSGFVTGWSDGEDGIRRIGRDEWEGIGDRDGSGQYGAGGDNEM